MFLLDFQKSKSLFLKYKIPLCQTDLMTSQDEAIKWAKKNGYPVVLKVSSPDILHKSDIGAVKTGIKNKTELSSAWSEIINSVKRLKSKVKIDGILIQKMLQGIEVVVGMKRDIQFGPVLMFGLGGIFVEVLRDVSFRIAPVSKKEAMGMIREIKGFKVLKGIRGEKPVKIENIAEIISKISVLSLREKQIKEIDLNPIICNEKGALVVDFRIIYET